MFNIGQLTTAHLVQIVLWLAVGVLSVDLVMVLFILMRRWSRRHYFDRKDAARQKYSEPVDEFLAGRVTADQLVPAVKNGRSRPSRDALQEMLMGHLNESNRVALTTVLFRLGLIETWAGEAFGRSRARQLLAHIAGVRALPAGKQRRFVRIRRARLFSVKRAQAVANLGQLDPRFAQVFMNEAMQDPSAYVGRANIAAMGRNRAAFEVTVLLEILRRSLAGTGELPVSTVKAALTRYPISELRHFVQFLDDPNSRFRYLVVDSIREMADNAGRALAVEDFPEDLVHWFMSKGPLDESADVRARSARVIRHFHTPAAAAALRALLQDPNEFVRLHTVRACADPYYSELLADTVRRVSDDKWRVREASVKAMLASGKAGKQQLAQQFLDTGDRYATEQIAEEMQRGDLVAEFLPELGSANGQSAQATNICLKLVRIGKASLLADLLAHETRMTRWGEGLASSDPQQARSRLLDILLTAPTSQLLSTMETLAGRKDDQLSARAEAILQSGVIQASVPPVRSKAAAAGGERKHA